MDYIQPALQMLDSKTACFSSWFSIRAYDKIGIDLIISYMRIYGEIPFPFLAWTDRVLTNCAILSLGSRNRLIISQFDKKFGFRIQVAVTRFCAQ